MKAKQPAPVARTAYFEIAADADGQWHWCLWSGNGRLMARNAEEYPRRKDVIQAIKTLVKLVPSVPLILASTAEAAEESPS